MQSFTNAVASPVASARVSTPIDASIEHIAVFRALQLGDLLCAVPALRALRAAFPHARVTLIGLPWARDFAARFNRYIDDFIAFPGAVGLVERVPSETETNEFVERARANRFDLALQWHGSGKYSNQVVASLGARHNAGFYSPSDACPDPLRFMRYPADEPEIRRLLRLLEFLDLPTQGEALEFPIAAAEWRALAELRANFGLQPGNYVCIHAGARAPARRWPPERFAHVADYLASQGLQVVLTGVAQELELTTAVARSMHAASLNLAGHAQMGVLAALLTGARLLVCNDTSVSHMAAALKVPSVVIFTGSSAERWAPLDRALHRRALHAVDCRPCEHWVCPIGHPCAMGVGVEEVIGEVRGLLR
jgi:ADP-heptose:LPS heptosyltransferase